MAQPLEIPLPALRSSTGQQAGLQRAAARPLSQSLHLDTGVQGAFRSSHISVGSNRFAGDWSRNICLAVGKS